MIGIIFSLPITRSTTTTLSRYGAVRSDPVELVGLMGFRQPNETVQTGCCPLDHSTGSSG